MRLVITTEAPAELQVVDASDSDLAALKDVLTFRDRQVEFLLARHKKNWRLKEADPERWVQQLETLKEQVNRCILLRHGDRFYSYSGLAEHIVQAIPGTTVSNEVEHPVCSGVAWDHVPEHENRVYQNEAAAALLRARHGAIQLPTGAGKSTIIRDLAHDIGMQAVIMAPSTSIARQLHDDFLYAFGKRNVGLYGDGRKDLKKFTIGISASLTRVESGTPAYDHFRRAQVFMADESHMCPADTLERVCMDVVAPAPYRFFFSATQTRTDGSEVLLKGITGPIVYEKCFKELVDEGFLAKPFWKMVKVPTSHFFSSNDALKMTQEHLYNSPFVLKKVTDIVNAVVQHHGHRVLILVDEMSQFTNLLPYLRFEARFAHGGVTKDNRKKLPEKYWDSDPRALVKAFDAGEFPILVGTSCISMGTDIRTPETVVYLQGGMSAVQVPQAVGRGTRRGYTYPDGHRKTSFNFIDVIPMIRNGTYEDGVQDTEAPMSIPYRHALARARLYNKLYPGTLTWL